MNSCRLTVLPAFRVLAKVGNRVPRVRAIALQSQIAHQSRSLSTSFVASRIYDGFRFRGLDDDDGFGSALVKKDWTNVELEKVVKNLYKPTEAVLNRSPEEVAAFRDQGRISIVRGMGGEVPNPVMSFDDINFSDPIKKMFAKMGFDQPMPIQAQGWPIALSGKDLIAIGETGSGKTLGYALPAISHILAQTQLRPGDGPIALVLAPTRELAQQIEKVVNPVVASCGLKSVCLFGGSHRGAQLKALYSGGPTSLIIATPGRLIDLLSTDDVNLARCSYVVLDEADRMLDMGFEPQIRKIVDQVRPNRQMLMWSATWPEEVRELAEDFLEDTDEYVHLNIGSTELQANHNIKQVIEMTDRSEKISKLNEALLSLAPKDKVLIFAQTKRTVDYIERMLYRDGLRVNAIHSDKSQTRRDHVMESFRTGRNPILVATDVASRGIDVDDIKMVINYDLPANIEDYVHRIGRTGRRGRSGVAVSFFTDEDAKLANDLVNVLEEADQEVPEDLRHVEWRPQKKWKRNSGFNQQNDRFKRHQNRFGRDRYDSWNDRDSRSQYRKSSYNRSFSHGRQNRQRDYDY